MKTVIVTGDHSLGDDYFAMPTHFPLLVIRDPPGGTSFAVYEEMQSTVQLTMNEYEKYMGVDAGITAQITLMEQTVSLCAGVGVAMSCSDAGATDNYIAGNIEGSTNFLSDMNDDTYSHGFTVTWSYTTSEETNGPGKSSDMFLVPTITILYALTITVSWNETLCQAKNTTDVKFDIGAPENERAFTIITQDHANNTEIPKLLKNLKILNDKLENNNTLTDDEIKKSQIMKETIMASYNTWMEFMADYEATNALADTGGSGLKNVGEWYNWYADTIIKPKCENQDRTYDCVKTCPEKIEKEDDDGLAWWKCVGNSACNDCGNSHTEKKKISFYRCVPEDLNMPTISSMFDSERENYFDDGGDLYCDVKNLEPDIPYVITNDISTNWTLISDDHEYWKKWSFYHPLPSDQPNTGLAPNSLISKAKIASQTKKIVDQAFGSTLEATGRIQFSGGGGVFSMTLEAEHLKSLVKKLDGAGVDDNAQQSFSIGPEVNVGGTIMGIGMEGNLRGGFQLETDHKVLSEQETSGSTSVSFELSDPDIGDEFFVDVFIDPTVSVYLSYFDNIWIEIMFWSLLPFISLGRVKLI